ncbi:MAG TPA: GH3 auxin-responsive promoter family protein [Bdellovibrionota bacterium]|nr:GH3 auxin-responsive promoter family protein [Bdellovibrionota bacterium]
MSSVISFLMNTIIKNQGVWLERDLNAQIDDLKRCQEDLLRKILARNAKTEFGTKHGFSDIKSVEDFRRLVPVLDYEYLRPYVERQDSTGAHALVNATPVFYAVTSGTTGKPKYIPLHSDALKSHSKSTNFFMAKLLRDRPRMFEGKTLAIVSPAVEGYMEASGRPFGSTSGHMYEATSPLIKNRYVVPSAIFAIEDYDVKYRAILRLALQEEQITYLTTANPSTIAKLVNLCAATFDQMIEDIETGSFRDLDKLSAPTRKAMQSRLRADRARAERLRQIRDMGGKPRIRDLWPDLQVVSTWTGGSSSIFLDQLKDQFSKDTLLRDPGYLASEFRGSVPITSGTNVGVPTFWNGYYEFAEQAAWDNGEKTFLGLHQLEHKKRYYIFITTDYGLYRYNMNDIIEVDGFYRTHCPLIRFVQKGKGVTSITGEKLYENQVLDAVARTEKEFGVDSEFFIMSCDPQESRYTLYYELSPTVKDTKLYRGGDGWIDECKRFQDRIDEVLGEINLEYHAKRQSGRVHPLRVVILKRGTYETFKRFYLSAGQREGQFKIVALQFAKDIKFDFTPYVGWNGTATDEENLEILSHTRHASLVKIPVDPSVYLSRPTVRLVDIERI